MREILPLAIGEAESRSGGKMREGVEQKEAGSRRCRSPSSPNIRDHDVRSSFLPSYCFSREGQVGAEPSSCGPS